MYMFKTLIGFGHARNRPNYHSNYRNITGCDQFQICFDSKIWHMVGSVWYGIKSIRNFGVVSGQS